MIAGTSREHENGVPNIDNPNVASSAYMTPFFQPNFHQPGMARCSNATVLRCNAYAIGAVAYLHYSRDSLGNISLRSEMSGANQGGCHHLDCRLHRDLFRLTEPAHGHGGNLL
jgi:hypothetical protein